MSVTISFELSDEDLEHFSNIAINAHKAINKGELDQELIINNSRVLIDKISKREKVPEFIRDSIQPLQLLLNMLGDQEWSLPEESRYRAIAALAYFTNPEDLIPDSIPFIGYLDDAIMIELIAQEMEPELNSYAEFCGYRDTEHQRRKGMDNEAEVTYDDWVADKRTEMHHRMSERRNARRDGGSFRLLGLGI